MAFLKARGARDKLVRGKLGATEDGKKALGGMDGRKKDLDMARTMYRALR